MQYSALHTKLSNSPFQCLSYLACTVANICDCPCEKPLFYLLSQWLVIWDFNIEKSEKLYNYNWLAIIKTIIICQRFVSCINSLAIVWMSNNCYCCYIIINFKLSNEGSRFMRVWRNSMYDELWWNDRHSFPDK